MEQLCIAAIRIRKYKKWKNKRIRMVTWIFSPIVAIKCFSNYDTTSFPTTPISTWHPWRSRDQGLMPCTTRLSSALCLNVIHKRCFQLTINLVAKCKRIILPFNKERMNKPYLCQGMGCQSQQPRIHGFMKPSTFFITNPFSLQTHNKLSKHIEKDVY